MQQDAPAIPAPESRTGALDEERFARLVELIRGELEAALERRFPAVEDAA